MAHRSLYAHRVICLPTSAPPGLATLGSTTRAADPELLQTLFEQSQDGVSLDDALRALSEMLGDHANAGEFEIDDEDFAAQARKELRSGSSSRWSLSEKGSCTRLMPSRRHCASHPRSADGA